jgi:hypothetical protein
MPQDELWIAAPRVTGFRCTYDLAMLGEATDVLMFRPTWSKNPSGNRNGGISITVPTYMRSHSPDIIKTAIEQMLGGDAKHVPSVVRGELSRLRDGYREGALGAP